MLINLVRLGMMDDAKKLSDSLNGYLNIYKSHMMTAIRALDFFNNIKLTAIHVVTSDYHVNRTRIIFNKMFNNVAPVEVFGVSTDACFDPLIVQNEQQSLEAFYQTFEGVDFSSEKQIFTALSKKHPFYNGEIYPKVFYS